MHTEVNQKDRLECDEMKVVEMILGFAVDYGWLLDGAMNNQKEQSATFQEE